ncbi:17905_t:CDS:1, partial [Acaulospora morrowiae]
ELESTGPKSMVRSASFAKNKKVALKRKRDDLSDNELNKEKDSSISDTVGEATKLIEEIAGNADDINNGQGSPDRIASLSQKTSARKKVKINKVTKKDANDGQDSLNLSHINPLNNTSDDRSTSINGRITSQKKKHNMRMAIRGKNVLRKSSVNEEESAEIISESIVINSPPMNIEEHKSRVNGNFTLQTNETLLKGSSKKESSSKKKKKRTKVSDQEISDEILKLTSSTISQVQNGMSSPQSPINGSTEGFSLLNGDDIEIKEEDDSINIATPKTIEGDDEISTPSATSTRNGRNSMLAQKEKGNVSQQRGGRRSPSLRIRKGTSRKKSRSSSSNGRSRGAKAVEELDSDNEFVVDNAIPTPRADRGESLGQLQ